MTIHDFAEMLNGRRYGDEMLPSEIAQARELGFTVVFGYSDDCVEFRGDYTDEIDCFNGGRVYEDGDKYIDAVWCDGEYSWTYKTNIPHATFDIYEDGEKYCRGIVFEKYERKCPICKYEFSMCQCRFGGSAHPDRSKRRAVVLDHLYLLSPKQLEHVINLEKQWQVSYGDEERTKIYEDLKGDKKG